MNDATQQTPAPVIPTVSVPQQTPEHHASLLHDLLSALGKVIHIATSPAVLALLPPNDRATVLAISAVGQVVVEAVEPSPAPAAVPPSPAP